MQIHACMHTHTCACFHNYTRMYAHTHMHKYAHIMVVHIHPLIDRSIHPCMHACIYIYGLLRSSLIMGVHPGCPVCSIVAASLVAVETDVGETISAAKVAFVCVSDLLGLLRSFLRALLPASALPASFLLS